MILSPSALPVIVAVVAMTSILVVLAVVARSRARRARQLAEIDALLSVSIVDARTWDDGTDAADDLGSNGIEPHAAPTPMRVIATVGGGKTSFGRDALTGLLDATAFEEAMSHEEAREQRYGHPATVIVIEIDGLANLVERHGPEASGRIEAALGHAIERLARRADHVARLERGRYAALLPETDEVAAINYVERIRSACDPWLESGAIAMRLAIGWASTTGDAGLTGAVRVATDRMRDELRRNARQVGDETARIIELDDGQAEDVA